MKYIIEHMEAGFTEWVILEYSQIIRDIGSENLILTSLPKEITENEIPKRLLDLGLQWTNKDVSEVIGETNKKSVCLLDPAAKSDLVPEDSSNFEYFVFGGILGDHPPRDRTGELREKYGFVGKRLGNLQMTTDTAVRTTQLIISKKTKFEDIKFIDYPEIRFSKHEATEMPFRYVLDNEGTPILPEGMINLIKKDNEKTLDDFF